MLGFPALFRSAGILPVIICTILVMLSSSLCGTMLAEAISMLPGNSNFDQSIDFSSAFRLCVGEDWYVIAETLFLMSCAVQACAGVVEAAQSLDGFMASFLFGRTWGLQFYPRLEFIEWSPSNCHLSSNVAIESGLADCTPFSNNGHVILTLGFVLTTAMFLPLGRGHLKETIFIQLLSTTCLFILLGQFSTEFFQRGFHFPLPWVGDSLADLAGVVLFNYAYSITIPAWLTEKQNHVSVNKTIWSTTAMATFLYLAFGLMGSMTFEHVGPNLLVLLASSKVHYLTRICAAIFGATIIGCGVPVFCVIIKNALYTNCVCSHDWAVFWGAYAPYLLSWLMYQGTILTTVLSWTGLVINGLVAFILPMVLAYRCLVARTAALKATAPTPDTLTGSRSYDALSSISVPVTIQDHEGVELTNKVPVGGPHARANHNGHAHHDHAHNHIHEFHGDGKDLQAQIEACLEQETEWDAIVNGVEALPSWLEPFRKYILLVIIVFFTTIISFTIFMDVVTGVSPDR